MALAAERHYFALDSMHHDVGGAIAGRGSAALLSKNRSTVKSAIVFVHGFGASPVISWSGYAQAAEAEPKFSSFDVYFYGYPSKSKQIGTLASALASFLGLLANTQLHPKILDSLGIQDATPYDRIIVAAHSMGGVVIREALLLLESLSPGATDKMVLRLFAPAHLGNRVAPAIIGAAVAFPPVQALLSALSFFLPAAEDLDPKQSVYLNRLRERTEALMKAGRNGFAAICVFGDDERIVIVGTFDGDERQVPDPSPHDHFSVVKITSSWRWPVVFITS